MANRELAAVDARHRLLLMYFESTSVLRCLETSFPLKKAEHLADPVQVGRGDLQAIRAGRPLGLVMPLAVNRR